MNLYSVVTIKTELAVDNNGMAVRDNTIAELIEIGKEEDN